MAEKKQAAATVNVAAICALFGCSAAIAADEETAPDMAFLEYLGSWAESDEDWVMLAAEAVEQVAQEETRKTDPASKEKESAETDDES